MIYLKFLRSLILHKWYVILAGRLTGVPLWRLILHDLTKFYPVEFFNYARFIFGEKNLLEWAKAWGHHQNTNKHHPEYWILSWRGDPNYYDPISERVASFVSVLPMPEIYVREMVADFLASSKLYTGSWVISEWVNTEAPKMILHKETVIILSDILVEMGYFLTDNCPWSWMAGDSFIKWAHEEIK